jgi:hypothetical protein
VKKKNVTNSEFLLNLIKKRGRAYSDLREMCWDNETQSDHAANRLSDELKSDLRAFLGGNFSIVNEKLTKYSRQPPLIAVRALRSSQKSLTQDLYTTAKTLRVGDCDVLLETTHSNAASPEELIYGIVRRALESGDIKNLALCHQCEKLFYRKSAKGKFCTDGCHDTHFNNLEDRADKAHDRYVEKMKELYGPNTVVARRPRKKA